MATWQVHRFRDHVGMCSGTGETVYLDIAQAAKLEAALRAARLSVKRERFSAAPSLTVAGEAIGSDAMRARGLPEMRRRDDGRALGYEHGRA